MKKFKKKNKILWIITFLLISALTVSMLFAFVRIDRNEKTKTLGDSFFTYSIGVIDEDGTFKDGSTAICTKDFYTVDGLICELEENANISYQIFFFDSEKEFLDDSLLSENFDSAEDTVPESAAYFKIMIIPANDTEVTFFEINDYASQLNVTFNK